MAVNVSARQLVSDSLLGHVQDALTEAGVEADRLCLEVTESAVIADPDAALETLERSSSSGCGSPSTTSAPATPRSPTCAPCCRSTC